MRFSIYSIAIISSLLLAHTSVMAQDKLDEFQAFRNKLNNKTKGESGSPGTYLPPGSRDVAEEEEGDSPLGAMDTLVTQMPPVVEKDPLEGMVIAESKISAVTVYNNRAKVTRIAEVTIPAGASTIAFKEMPALLLGDSLRADGMSKATVKFGALSHKKVFLTKPAPPRERGLAEAIEKLQDNVRFIETQNVGLAAKKALLENIGQQATLRYAPTRNWPS